MSVHAAASAIMASDGGSICTLFRRYPVENCAALSSLRARLVFLDVTAARANAMPMASSIIPTHAPTVLSLHAASILPRSDCTVLSYHALFIGHCLSCNTAGRCRRQRNIPGMMLAHDWGVRGGRTRGTESSLSTAPPSSRAGEAMKINMLDRSIEFLAIRI